MVHRYLPGGGDTIITQGEAQPLNSGCANSPNVFIPSPGSRISFVIVKVLSYLILELGSPHIFLFNCLLCTVDRPHPSSGWVVRVLVILIATNQNLTVLCKRQSMNGEVGQRAADALCGLRNIAINSASATDDFKMQRTFKDIL